MRDFTVYEIKSGGNSGKSEPDYILATNLQSAIEEWNEENKYKYVGIRITSATEYLKNVYVSKEIDKGESE